MWRPITLNLLAIIALLAAMTVTTQAAFTAKATLTGITFSTGTAELKLFGNLGYTHIWNNGNLYPGQRGGTFADIGPNWKGSQPLKYINTGSVPLMTSIRAVVGNDPAGLADDITVSVWQWQDTDGNGQESNTDTFTQLSSPQPLSEMVSNSVTLGQLQRHDPKGLMLRFTTGDLSNETQKQSLSVEFIIDGTTQGVTQ